MDVLVTGGAGFLGSHLCGRLLERNHRVVCFDNLVTGRKENINPFRQSNRFEFLHHDVSEYIDTNDSKMLRESRNVDIVLHFASPASPEDYQKYPIKTLKVGSIGTHRALGVARKFDAKFLLASTSEVYGDPDEHPQPEDYWGHVNPIGYRGAYDESKRFAEALTMAYHRRHNIDTRIVRIFNTYGPRMRLQDGRVVPNFLRQALTGEPLTVYGDGQQTRSFCYVTDLIDGILSLLESELVNPVNIGNPNEITIEQFAHKVIDVVNSSSEIVNEKLPEDDPERRKPDIQRAREKLNWEPKVTLEEGLKKTMPYFEEELKNTS